MRRVHTFAAAAAILVLAGATGARASVTGTPVSLEAADGTMLAATYYAGDKPGPGILLLHQCNKDRSGWNGLAESLAKQGFRVLTMDYRGFGESGGKRFADLAPAETSRMLDEVFPADVDVAYDYLRSQPGVQGVMGAGGASCGVNQSILLSKRHPEVKTLVLLSGSTHPDGRNYLHGRPTMPLFLAAADDDDGAYELIAWIDASSGNPANRLVEYKTGGHGVDMFKANPELPGDIVAWYEATISGHGKPASTNNHAHEAPRIRVLRMTDEPDGFAKAAETMNAEIKTNPKSPILDPAFVNFVGYLAIPQGQTKAAVAIMKVNVQSHPTSANAWDSLGDAYLAGGQRDQAREASEKALQLLDADTSLTDQVRKEVRESAQQKLDQLKAAPTSK